MKTLVKPRMNSTIATSCLESYPENRIEILKYKNSHRFAYLKLILLVLPFSILLIFPESPQISETICNKYHSEYACQSW